MTQRRPDSPASIALWLNALNDVRRHRALQVKTPAIHRYWNDAAVLKTWLRYPYTYDPDFPQHHPSWFPTINNGDVFLRRRIAELEPENFEIRMALAEQVPNREATVIYGEAIKLKPDCMYARIQQAEQFEKGGLTKEACVAWEEIARRSPYSREPLDSLARLYSSMESLKKATHICRKADDLLERGLLESLSLGTNIFNFDNKVHSNQTWEIAAYELGKAGRYLECYRFFNNPVRFFNNSNPNSPTHGEISGYLAVMALRAQLRNEALAWAEIAVRFEGESVVKRENNQLGWAVIAMIKTEERRWDEAKSALDQMGDGGHPMISIFYGESYDTLRKSLLAQINPSL